jgi:hypothetical protein
VKLVDEANAKQYSIIEERKKMECEEKIKKLKKVKKREVQRKEIEKKVEKISQWRKKF